MVIVFDLDDTLYDEIDFVYSGFKEISKYLANDKYYDFMVDIFKKDGSGEVFNKLLKEFDLDVSLAKLISIYRYHRPDISLNDDAIKLLEFAKGYNTALISDGDYITQSNKFRALSLENYIKFPIFTDFYHTKKPETKAYEMVMREFIDKRYLYISDNPKKDFFATKKLGWSSIRFKNPVGIYKDIPNCADYEVSSRAEILRVLKGLI